MHNEFDLMREFDEMLDQDSEPIVVCEMEFFPSDALKSDQEAYREQFLGWCSENNYDF